MVLYHGSNIEVKKPEIIQSKRLLDFGTGFYLTSDYEQAKKWAVRTTARREEGIPTVSIFLFDESKLEKLKLFIAIQLLLPQNLKDQYAFKTEKALSVLKFSEVNFI